MTQSTTGTTLTTITTVFGTISKSIPMTITTTMPAKIMETSFREPTVKTMTTMATMPTSMRTVSSKQFGTAVLCRKASENHHFTTSTTTTMVCPMPKTRTTITMVFWTSTKNSSRDVSGAKKALHSITTMTESWIGQMMTGTATASQTPSNLQSASPHHSTTTTMVPVTTSTMTTMKTA